jgi:hypothetical protein
MAEPPQIDPQPVAVTVVNYNTCDHLRACLATVDAESPVEVVILDNASTDGSAEMVRASYPHFKLVVNEKNPGYGAAANQAIGNCTSEYVLLLNSDTLLKPGAVQSLRAYLDGHPQAAIVGPRILNPDGSLQVSCFHFPSPLFAFLRSNTLGTLIRYIPFLRDRYLPAWSHNRPRRVPWVLGAALAIRRKAFEEVGGFDESFFMYSEEVDLSYRLNAAGWQVHFAPVADIVHVGGASTDRLKTEMEIQRYSSTTLFYRRHYSSGRMLLLRLIVSYSLFRNLIRDSTRLVLASRRDQQAALVENCSIWKRILWRQWQE